MVAKLFLGVLPVLLLLRLLHLLLPARVVHGQLPAGGFFLSVLLPDRLRTSPHVRGDHLLRVLALSPLHLRADKERLGQLLPMGERL